MSNVISGRTRVYFMLGHPIAQVKTPTFFNDMLAEANIDSVVVALNVKPENLKETVLSLKAADNVAGFFVTIPHKISMMEFADVLLPGSLRTGATNALRREPDGSWSADMFDGVGFMNALHQKSMSVAGKRIRIYGAGGAGMAIAVSLADAGAIEINFVDPDHNKAKEIASQLSQHCPDTRFIANERQWQDAEMIINASPVGMNDSSAMPETLGMLAPDVLIGDVIIRAHGTALIAHAKACGCKWVDGVDMHSGQMKALMEFFN